MPITDPKSVLTPRRWSPNPDDVFELTANLQRRKLAREQAAAALEQAKKNRERAEEDVQHAKMLLLRAKGLTQGEVNALLASYHSPEHRYVETRKEWPFPGTDLYREALYERGYYSANYLTEAGVAEAKRILAERAAKERPKRKAKRP